MSVTEEMDHCGRGVLIVEERTSQTTAMQVTRNVMVAEKLAITYGYAQRMRRRAITGIRVKLILVFMSTK